LLVALSGPKKVLISGSTPSNGPHNGYCPHQNHYVPRHIFRYINSYTITAQQMACTTAPHILILKSSKINSGLQLDLDIFFFAKILFLLHDPVLLLPYLDIYIFFIIFQLYIGTTSLEMTALQ
jgi:hypothetical protein